MSNQIQPEKVNTIVGCMRMLPDFKNRYVVCVDRPGDSMCAQGQGDGFASLEEAKAWAGSAFCSGDVTIWDNHEDQEVYRL
jgi:hypothetical protein